VRLFGMWLKRTYLCTRYQEDSRGILLCVLGGIDVLEFGVCRSVAEFRPSLRKGDRSGGLDLNLL
jgi:hypothetical protein